MSKLAKADRPFSRAKAKKWFARSFPDHKVFRYDGNKTFHLLPVDGQPRIDCLRFGKFVFTHHPPGVIEP